MSFFIDDARIWRRLSHRTVALGVVIWIDNQYAALPPDGRLRYGTLENQERAWIEIKNIQAGSRSMTLLDKPLTCE